MGIPAEKRADGRLLICTADGASLHYGNSRGELVEDASYKDNALGTIDGVKGVAGLHPEVMPDLLGIARDIQLAFFDDLLVDNTLLAYLGPRDQESYTKILKRIIRATKGMPLGATYDFGEPYATEKD